MAISKITMLTLALSYAFLCLPVHADLWNDGGFEGKLGWTGTDSFNGASATNGAAPNGATFFTLVHDELVTESGVWIDDPKRAYEGNRMFWLRNYADPDTICVGHRFTNVFIPGQQYEVSWKFAAFDVSNPSGSSKIMTKPISEVMAWTPELGYVVTEQVVRFDDGRVTDPNSGTFAEFAVQDWDNLTWYTATSVFVAPADNGQPVYVWVSMSKDSNGILLDNISLQAVPEPTALAILGLASLLGLLRRQKIIC